MFNLRLFSLSILALLFLILAFIWNTWFIAGAVAIMLINQKELMKHSSKNNKPK
jgi:preprotein translocase subunit SecF